MTLESDVLEKEQKREIGYSGVRSDNSLLSKETLLFFDRFKKRRSQFRRRYIYYHQDNLNYFQKSIQNDSRVLLVGCDMTWLSENLQCQELYRLELDPARFHDSAPAYVRKVSSLNEALASARIDYVILPYTLQYLEDIQTFLETLHQGLPGTARIINVQYNFLWAPVLKLAEQLRLKN